MIGYRLAGQDFYFSWPVPELEPFETTGMQAVDAGSAATFVRPTFQNGERRQLQGWVGSAQRSVEVHDTPRGLLLKVEGCNDFLISPRGETIGKPDSQEPFSALEREILAGPAMVLALALRDVWSLHASAAIFNDHMIAFLGESGQGKSTLAAYLSQNPGWRLAADDILPATIESSGAVVWPRFPQLKLATNTQPGIHLPEQLPLKVICVLTPAEPDRMPELQKISGAQTAQALLSHIAGTRMFNTALLAKHLAFSTQAAQQITAYRLIHPHRRDTLPLVKEFLETIC